MFPAVRPHAFAMTVACFLFPIGASNAADWIASPSFYTHSPETGGRTDQFRADTVVMAPAEDPNSRGVYRHYRSSLRVPGFADNLHVVDRSGFEVRPYGEWQFPYRPYSVPYYQWGPQLPLVVGNGWGWGWGGGPWNGGPWTGGPTQPGHPGGPGFPGGGFPGGPGAPGGYPVGQGWPNQPGMPGPGGPVVPPMTPPGDSLLP